MGKTPIAERSELAQNIIRLRKRRGWSQEDLADKAGLHVNSIKLIETDGSEGHLETRRAIAGALGCTLSDLYKEANQKKIPDIDGTLEFLAKYAALPIGLQRMVLALVYQDTSYVRGLEIPSDVLAKLRDGLLGPLSKAK